MIITISRQAGTNGALIGHLVAERLGLRLFDRELVDEVARRLQVEAPVAVQFDETVLTPVAQVLSEWRSSITEDLYFRSLRQALQHITKEGKAVIIGRGANFVLHCPDCLHVRLVAPIALRTAIWRTTHDIPEPEALRMLDEVDARREHFIRHFFHAEVADPVHYDLVINLAGLTPEMTAEIIAHAARLRVVESLPVRPHATLPHHIAIMARHRKTAPATIVEPSPRNKG